MKNDNTKLSKNREKKEAIVAEVSDKVKKAKALVFTNYQGMTHRQMEELKKTLKTMDADMMVTKNTLLKLALDQAESVKGQGESKGKNDLPLNALPLTLEGPTATLFAYADVVAPLKELAKVIKATQLPAIKFGIFEGKVLNDKDVVRLSALPPREVLIAQLVSGLKSPIFGLHRTLSWNMQKFVMTLKAIEAKKS